MHAQSWGFHSLVGNVPVKSKLKHPPPPSRANPGIWRLLLPPGRGIWSLLIGGGELITSFDFMLHRADSTWGDKSWRRQALIHSKQKAPDSWWTGWKAKACTSFALYLIVFKNHLYYLWHVGVLSVKPCLHTQLLEHNRESPIGFSGSGIWLISRPGFRILEEKGDEIRDCNYDRDTGFGDFNRRESGKVALKKPRFGNSRDWNMWRKSSILAHLINVLNSWTMTKSTCTFPTILARCSVTPIRVISYLCFSFESYNTVTRTLYTRQNRSNAASSTGASISVASSWARSTTNWGRAREGSREGERREVKQRLASFSPPFLPCTPTTFAARERRLGMPRLKCPAYRSKQDKLQSRERRSCLIERWISMEI